MAEETDILLNGGITLVAKSFSEERPGQQLVEGLCDVYPERTFVPGCFPDP